jgi:3-(3-hydroxy-phenyl)propionate hydroxylase
LRNAVLALAPHAEFARRMVNSGRLSTATVHASPLSTPDEDVFGGSIQLGAPISDAPIGTGFLLERLGTGFELLYAKDGAPPPLPEGVRLRVIGEDLRDETGVLTRRLDARPGSAYLLRPDHHLCARWRSVEIGKVEAALARAHGH